MSRCRPEKASWTMYLQSCSCTRRHELAPERDRLVPVDVRVVGDDQAARVDRRVRGDDRAHAAARRLQVPVDVGLGPGAVVGREAAGEARAEDPVLDREVPEGEAARRGRSAPVTSETLPRGGPRSSNAAEIPMWRSLPMAGSLSSAGMWPASLPAPVPV